MATPTRAPTAPEDSPWSRILVPGGPAAGAGRQRILLVEDSPTQALRTQLILEDAGWEVVLCGSGADAVEMAEAASPDLILLDMHLPGLDGTEVAHRVKSHPALADTPIIVLTGVFHEVEHIVDGLGRGAVDYMLKTVSDSELIARIRACLRVRKLQRELGRLAGLLLSIHKIGGQFAGILDLPTLLDTACLLFHRVLGFPTVGVYLAEGDGLVLSAAAGANARPLLEGCARAARGGDDIVAACLRAKAIVFATRSPYEGPCPVLDRLDAGVAVPLFNGGAVCGVLVVEGLADQAFDQGHELTLATIADQLGTAIHNARLYRAMEDLATRDTLTSLLNRRAILARFDDEWARCRRYSHPLSVLSIDIDRFKGINDTYGHAAGDEAIVAVASAIARTIRREDAAGRLGGDEFLIVLPETDSHGTREAAERLRSEVEGLTIGGADGRPPVSVTLSLGVTSWPETPADDPAELLRASDLALYRAKAAGRNRVSL